MPEPVQLVSLGVQAALYFGRIGKLTRSHFPPAPPVLVGAALLRQSAQNSVLLPAVVPDCKARQRIWRFLLRPVHW